METPLAFSEPVAASGHARGTLRVLFGLFLVPATVALISLAYADNHRGSVPVSSGVGLAVAATFVLVGLVDWDGASVPLPALAGVVGAAGLAASRVSAPGHRFGPAVATVAGCLLLAMWPHLLLAFPSRHIRRTAARFRIVLVGYVAAAAVAAGIVSAKAALTLPAGVTWFAVVGLCCIPAVKRGYTEGRSRDRDQLRWLAVGAALATDLSVIIAVLHALIGWPRPVGAAAASTAVLVGLALLAGGSARVGPAGGRVLVSVLSVVGFTLVMALIYLVIVLGLGSVPDGSSDKETLGLSMVAASIAAVAFVPARERLIRSATRLVYGARQAPDEVVRSFGSRLSRAIPMDELLLQLCESLTTTLGLSSAVVYTGAGEVLERAASVPDEAPGPVSLVVSERERPVVTRAGVSGSAWAAVWLPALLDAGSTGQLRVAPIRNAGELLGVLVVERTSNADPFSEDDDRVLADLAREVGLAFHNVQLDAALQNTLAEVRAQAAELRESRARIVASGDAERRRVERNLHDGAQQNLVALAVSMRLARDMVGSDPEALGEMLDAMATEVQRTIQELRELAHGIYPPLLVDSGLGAALSAAAGRSPLDVTVDAGAIGRYPTEVEAAVYFCCLEALQNAGKHAQEAKVEVRLWEESGGLLFTVTDDGPGFDPAAVSRGHGFVNMSDRLGAIGGSVRWESEPGQGARVWGSIPLA